MQPRTQLSSAIFNPGKMRTDILTRNEISNQMEPNPGESNVSNFPFGLMCIELVCCNSCVFSHPILDIPTEIDNYHALCLLETLAIHQKLPLPSSTYKATHNTTGIKYCLRRLHGI